MCLYLFAKISFRKSLDVSKYLCAVYVSALARKNKRAGQFCKFEGTICEEVLRPSRGIVMEGAGLLPE